MKGHLGLQKPHRQEGSATRHVPPLTEDQVASWAAVGSDLPVWGPVMHCSQRQRSVCTMHGLKNEVAHDQIGCMPAN